MAGNKLNEERQMTIKFHKLERNLFHRLVHDLGQDPTNMRWVMAFWLWLESAGHDDFVRRANAMPGPVVLRIVEEAVACLRCLAGEVPDVDSRDSRLPCTNAFLAHPIDNVGCFIEGRDMALQGVNYFYRNVSLVVCVGNNTGAMRAAQAQPRINVPEHREATATVMSSSPTRAAAPPPPVMSRPARAAPPPPVMTTPARSTPEMMSSFPGHNTPQMVSSFPSHNATQMVNSFPGHGAPQIMSSPVHAAPMMMMSSPVPVAPMMMMSSPIPAAPMMMMSSPIPAVPTPQMMMISSPAYAAPPMMMVNSPDPAALQMMSSPYQVAPPMLNPMASPWAPMEVQSTMPEDYRSPLPEDYRSLFVTFSKGYPISRDDIIEFFNSTFGPCVEAVMLENVQPGEMPVYGRVVLRSAAMTPVVLDGQHSNKFVINGKHLWARVYVPNSRLTV